MKQLRLVSLIALSMTAASFARAAIPVVNSITSVNGSTITNGARMTLGGSNFVAQALTKPLSHGSFFKDINPSTYSLLTTWNENSNMAWTASVSTGLPGVTGTAYGIWASSATMQAFHFRVQSPTPLQVVYVYWRKWTSQGSTPNNKFFRIWRNGNQGPNDFVTSTDQGGVCFNESEPSISGNVGGYQYAYFSTGTWSNQRAIWTRSGGTGKNSDGSAGGGATGIWDFMVNGQNWQHRENVDNFQDLLTEVVVGDFTDSAHLQLNGTMIQIPFVVVSTTAYGVFLSTNNTWAKAQFDMQWQPVISRSDTSITFDVDRTGIDTSKQVYVYVMGASTSDVNSTGFAATFAGCTGTSVAISSFSNVFQSSFSVTFSSVGASWQITMSTNSDFSAPRSSAVVTQITTTYVNLSSNTVHYFQVKIATENDCTLVSASTTTTTYAPVVPGGSFPPPPVPVFRYYKVELFEEFYRQRMAYYLRALGLRKKAA